ncbi:MAG: Gfo/Idh/MocA family protein [Anaerolineae bacterium]
MKVRIAIVGCGGIANAHINAYHANQEQCEVVACADTVSDAAQAFGAKHGIPAFSDVATMLDTIKPDAISICTPPIGHLPVTILAAERGMHILCEKPLARNTAEAQEMVALVKRHGILFMNGLCHRFHGPINQAKDLFASGTLGKLIHFYNRFASRFDDVEKRWFVDPEISGGGVLYDTAVHSVDIFRYVVGEVSTIQAQMSTTLPIRSEDSAALLLGSVDGVSGDIACSWITPPPEWIIRLYGTDGTAEIDYSAEPNLRYRLAKGDWISVAYAGPDRFTLEIRHFLECVQNGKTPCISVEEGARTIELIQAAYASTGISRTGLK